MVIKGAIKKMKELEILGIVASFIINLTPSAIGCNKPKPVSFGPFLRWIVPITFLSASVKKAILNKTGTINTKKEIKDIIIFIIFN